MKPLRNALATLLLAALPAAAQDADPPVPVAAETAAEPAVHPVPPVRLTNIVVQTIGEERHNEELRPGLLFIDESSGKLMVSDESNPHGRFVCACKDFPDYHNFTNTIRVNGHKIELNRAFSLQAEDDILSFRFDTNSVLQIIPVDVGEYVRITASYEDESHLLVSANAPADAVLQVTTNLLAPTPWTTATNAVVAESDDAATIWRVTLDNASTGVEIYRVLGSVARPAGAYAYKPIRAEQGVVIPEGQGIEMAGERWNEWPNVGAIATNAANAAVAPVSSRVGAIESDYVQSGDLAGFATTGTVASLGRRIGAVEEELEEYWCKWTSATMQADMTNWIPTNWPARTVFCYVYIDEPGCIISLPNWTPAEEYTLHLRLIKTTNGTFFVRSANGTTLQSLSTTGSVMYRECEFVYRESVGWLVTFISMANPPFCVVDGIRHAFPNDFLPEDEFLPVHTSLDLMSPANSPMLTPLSPGLQPEAAQ